MNRRVMGSSKLRATVLLAALAAPSNPQAPIPDEPIPDEDVAISVAAGAARVEFGVAFPLTVVRSWRNHLVPDEWSDELLAPLGVRLVDTRRRTDGNHIEETRTYRAYAFRPGELTVPAPWFRARSPDGGAEHIALADDLHLEVLSALGPEADPESVELPPGPLPAPFPWVRWSVLGLLAVTALGFVAVRVRRRAPRRAPEPQGIPLPAHVRALRRLEELRARSPGSRDELRADSVEASSLVRDYIEERFAVRAPDMTTDDLLAHPRTAAALRPAHRALLTDYLAHCDLVKFARHRPGPGERGRQLDAAEAFLRETGQNGAPNSASGNGTP